MSSHEIDWAKPQRQSASALVILVYKALLSLVKFLWPLLLLMILRKRTEGINTYEVIALVISILSLTRSAFEYFNFRFYIANGELVLKKGFFTKRTITLPLEKIQAVHVEQSWLHNLFKVSSLSFDSAGSEKMEIKIEALDRARSSSLRELILGSRTEAAVAEAPAMQEQTLITLGPNDLFKLSLSANHVEAFVLLLAFGFSSIQSIGVSDKEYSGVMKWIYDSFQSGTFKMVLFLIAFILIVSVGISVIRVFLTYTDFIITRSEKGFRIRTGMINKKEKFIPFRKIQYMSWKANWVRQKIGLFMMQFHATGSDQMQNKMQQVRAPLTRPSFIPVLLENYHPLLPVSEIEALRVHKKYISRRVFILGIIPVAVILPILYYYIGLKALPVAGLIGIVWFGCWLFQRKFRLWSGSEALQIKKGFFGKHELILKWNKIQSIHLLQSIYQRNHNLATMEVYTAGGTITIPYLPVEQAQQIQNYALYKIESSLEPWS